MAFIKFIHLLIFYRERNFEAGQAKKPEALKRKAPNRMQRGRTTRPERALLLSHLGMHDVHNICI